MIVYHDAMFRQGNKGEGAVVMVVRCAQPTIVAVTYNCDLKPHNPAPLDQMTLHIGIREEVACSRLQDNKKSEERNALEKRVG